VPNLLLCKSDFTIITASLSNYMSFRNEQVESQQYQKQGQPRPPTNIPASRSKKDVMSTDRLHISPSPIKKADISQNRAKGKVEVNQVP
jgi:hypothetical protein